VRCILARLVLSGANCLIIDEPTNHHDLEAIEALDPPPAPALQTPCIMR